MLPGGGPIERQEKFDKSILDYNKALELNLKIDQVFGPQGANYLALKQPGKALEYFDATIDLIESDPEKYSSYGYFRYMQRGMCHYQLKEYDKAISDFKKVIGFEQPADTIMMGQNSYVAMHKMLGIVYLGTGDNEKAREYLEKGLQLAQDRGLDITAQEIQALLSKL